MISIIFGYVLFIIFAMEYDLRKNFFCGCTTYPLPAKGQGAFIEIVPGIFGKSCLSGFISGDILFVVDDNISINILESAGVNELAEITISAVLIENVFEADVGMPFFFVYGLQYRLCFRTTCLYHANEGRLP